MARPSTEASPPQKRALLASVGVSVALWLLPFGSLVLLPLLYLNTHFHELCHALVALATGGRVQHILVFANGSGVTPVSTQGPLGLLFTASAGYTGAAVIGAGIIALSRNPKAARSVIKGLCIVLSLSMLLFVRGDAVGLASGVFWVVALWLLASKASDDGVFFAAQFIGLQQGLNAFGSLRDLIYLTRTTEVQSDAAILQNASGIPAMAWALAWVIFSGVALFMGFRIALRQNRRAESR